MKKKGFTLIELLSVIVILAILALIVIPFIVNVVESARKGAAVDTVYGYVDALNKDIFLGEFSSSNTKLLDGKYDVVDLDVSVKGQKPLYGEVSITDSIVTSANLCINGYWVNYSDSNAITNGKCTQNTTATAIVITNEKATTNSFEIIFDISDEVGIKDIKCYYGLDDQYKNEGKIENNTCSVKGLQNDNVYNYKIEVKNKAGNVTSKKSSIRTIDFEKINITPDIIDWASSKEITITGSASGTKLQYQVGPSVDESKWQDYTGTITIVENTNVYARLTDGVNISSTKTYSEAKIDTTNPEIIIGNVTSTTNSITIPIGISDLESGIKEKTCIYGKSTSYGSTGTMNSEGTSCTLNSLTSGTTYYYKISAINNAGVESIQESNYNSVNINQTITITPNSTVYATSRNITITGSATGARLQYQIGASVDESKWQDYTGAFSITANTNVYARLYDDANISSTKTYSEAKIDRTPPSLTVGSNVTTDVTKAYNPLTGVKANDNVNGDVTSKVTYTSSPAYNNKKSGTYTITYASVDNLNNKTTGSKTITIKPVYRYSDITTTVTSNVEYRSRSITINKTCVCPSTCGCPSTCKCPTSYKCSCGTKECGCKYTCPSGYTLIGGTGCTNNGGASTISATYKCTEDCKNCACAATYTCSCPSTCACPSTCDCPAQYGTWSAWSTTAKTASASLDVEKRYWTNYSAWSTTVYTKSSTRRVQKQDNGTTTQL